MLRERQMHGASPSSWVAAVVMQSWLSFGTESGLRPRVNLVPHRSSDESMSFECCFRSHAMLEN